MNTRTLETRCANGGVACQHVAALTKAGQTAIHVMGYPEHGRRLLEHARLLAEIHGYGVDGDSDRDRATLQDAAT
jgi:hypothetical protein